MGPKKGKGKKGGLSEEEERRRREELMQKFLQMKAGKELIQSHLNERKLTNKWRSILRDIKSEELKQDIEILSQTFERVVDRKEHVIKNLTEAIQNSEEQHRIAISGHLYNINKLIDIQKERLSLLENNFESEKSALVDDFQNQRNKIKQTYKDDMEYMADLIFSLETTYMNAEHGYKSDFQSRMDEIRNKNTEERQHMREVLEHHMEEIWQQMQQTLQIYNENTEDRRKAYESLKEKDEKSSRIIDLQMNMIQKINDTIANLKNKIIQTTKEQEEKSACLLEDREKLKKQFMSLKNHLKMVENKHRDYLLHLTAVSNETLKNLEKQVEQAGKVIRLGEMCAKYETEEEKILPFYKSSVSVEEKKELVSAESTSPKEPLAGLLNDYVGLENFWKRFNKVRLDKLALEKEKNVLVSENEQLCQILRHYLENVTVQEDAVSQPDNSLLMVNKQKMLKLGLVVPVTDTRVTRICQTAPIKAVREIEYTS